MADDDHLNDETTGADSEAAGDNNPQGAEQAEPQAEPAGDPAAGGQSQTADEQRRSTNTEHPEESGETQEFSDKVAEVIAGVVMLLIGVLLLWGIFQFFRSGSNDLTVTARVVKQADETKVVAGHVQKNKAPVSGAKVFIEALDDTGNWLVQPDKATVTNDSGGFTVPLTTPDPDKVHVHASLDKWWWWNAKTGTHTLTLEHKNNEIEDAGHREILTGVTVASFILLWFMATVVVALMMTPKRIVWVRAKYYLIVLMTFLFPLFVATTFGVAHSRLVEAAGENQIVSLGVVTVFKGTFVRDVKPEWLISLTLPTFSEQADRALVESQPNSPTESAGGQSADGEKDSLDAAGANGESEPPSPPAPAAKPPSALQAEPAVVEGFGAPLWVIFLSVIGAAIFTIALIVKEIAEPPDFDEKETLLARIQLLVEHEFYILFAPVGGIFVYQLMVLGNAANEPVTVAIAALGAGVSINAILSRAVGASDRVVSAQERTRREARASRDARRSVQPERPPSEPQPPANDANASQEERPPEH